ncbi:hypothetical protein ACFE04_024544 [Oxalis oulophora]
MFSSTEMLSMTSVLSTYTTIATLAMVVRTIMAEVQSLAAQFIPDTLRDKILEKLGLLVGKITTQEMTLVIDEYEGMSVNELYQACQTYLSTRISPLVSELKISKLPRQKAISVTINKGQKLEQDFQGLKLIWEFETQKSDETNSGGGDYDDYTSGPWSSVPLDHPSTFDTMAMDPARKKDLIDDLDQFLNRREFYKRVGKAWKRGYLLYGPPGTGKSSLIAAMANYLKFDIYDMELTSIYCNQELKRLLLGTANRSILVIEDIDCSIDLENRNAEEGYNRSNEKGKVEATPAEIAEELLKKNGGIDASLRGVIDLLKRKSEVNKQEKLEDVKEETMEEDETEAKVGGKRKVKRRRRSRRKDKF